MANTIKCADLFRALYTMARNALPESERDKVQSIRVEMHKRFYMRAMLHRTQEMKLFVLDNGIERLIADTKKGRQPGQMGGKGRIEDVRQYAMAWPEEARQVVEDIGVLAVHVPSTGELLPLLPDKITADQLDEAGDYLIKMGKYTIGRGENCKRLAEITRRTHNLTP